MECISFTELVNSLQLSFLAFLTAFVCFFQSSFSAEYCCSVGCLLLLYTSLSICLCSFRVSSQSSFQNRCDTFGRISLSWPPLSSRQVRIHLWSLPHAFSISDSDHLSFSPLIFGILSSICILNFTQSTLLYPLIFFFSFTFLISSSK